MHLTNIFKSNSQYWMSNYIEEGKTRDNDSRKIENNEVFPK